MIPVTIKMTGSLMDKTVMVKDIMIANIRRPEINRIIPMIFKHRIRFVYARSMLIPYFAIFNIV